MAGTEGMIESMRATWAPVQNEHPRIRTYRSMDRLSMITYGSISAVSQNQAWYAAPPQSSFPSPPLSSALFPPPSLLPLFPPPSLPSPLSTGYPVCYSMLLVV